MQSLYKDLGADTQTAFVYSHALSDGEEPDNTDAKEPPSTTTAAGKRPKKRNEALRYAGVEGGGTTWVCAIAEAECDNIVERAEFPTTTPEETLKAVREWLDAKAAEKPFDALGVATFGPLDLDPGSDTYGFITHSPKPEWENVNVLGALSDGIVPCGFDTDVNAPAVAEFAAMKKPNS